jgi:hypothetical protein
MAQVESSGYCPTCKQRRLIRRRGTNHVLHLILTVLTLGLWGIVWIALAINNRSHPSRCTVCGTAVSGHAMPNDKAPPERGFEGRVAGGASG